jgi:hypothetical protein
MALHAQAHCCQKQELGVWLEIELGQLNLFQALVDGLDLNLLTTSLVNVFVLSVPLVIHC